MRAPMKLVLMMVVASATVLSAAAFTFDESKGAIDNDSVGVVAPVDEIMTKGGIIENATPAPTVSDNAIETAQPTDLTEKSFTGSNTDTPLENKTLTKKGVDTAVTPSPTFSGDITFETSQETDVIPAPTDELYPDIDVTPAPTGALDTDTDVMSALKEGAKTPCPTQPQADLAESPPTTEIPTTPTDEELPVEEAPNGGVHPAEEVPPAPLTSTIEESTSAKTPCPPLSQPTQGPAVYIDEPTFTNDTSFDTLVTPEPTIPTSDETELFGSIENSEGVTPALNASSDGPITSSGTTPCTVPPIAGSSSSATPAPTVTNDKDGANTATGIVPCPPLPQPKTPCPPLPQPKTPCPTLPQPKTPCPTLPQPKTPCPTLPQPEPPRQSLVPPTEAVSSDEIVQRQQSSSDARVQASTAAGRIVSGLALVAVSTIYLVL